MEFLSKIDRKFVDDLHKPNEIRPYAISIKREEPFLNFHLVSIKEEISNALLKLLLSSEDIPLQIGGWEFLLGRIKFENIPMMSFMRSPKRVVKFRVRFLTPTYFNIRDRKFDIRLPESIFLFPNIAKIWNQFAPHGCQLNENELYQWVSANVFPSSFELRTRRLNIGKKTTKSGCVGWANYLVIDHKNDYSNWLDILMRFAEFVNVGGNRTAACGVIKYKQMEIAE